ncbi:MAG TPA: GAF domain-containing protein [Rhizomicrobium sp.]|nr:GAF domain-containing protein [Rhizomicrobium sp.]
MSGFEQSYAIRSDLLTKLERKLALAEHRAAVIETVRQTARGICKSDGISFILREGEMCHYVEEDAIGPLWKGQRFPLNACISGWTMEHGETAVIEDVFEDPRIPYDAYLPTFVKSLIMTPMGDRNVAAIGAYWKDRRRFSDLEIMTVKTFSALVGKALSDLLDK